VRICRVDDANKEERREREGGRRDGDLRLAPGVLDFNKIQPVLCAVAHGLSGRKGERERGREGGRERGRGES